MCGKAAGPRGRLVNCRWMGLPQELTSVTLAGRVVAIQLAQQRANTAQDVRLRLCRDMNMNTTA